MLVFRRSPFYGLCMIAGALLIGIAGLCHPVLNGDGAAQLGAISRTAAWRTMHWALGFGLPLLYAGLVGVALRHLDTPSGNQARAGVMLAGFAFAVWAINILFMAGAATQLARAYLIGEPGLTATRAVFLYDMLHPFGLAAERLATFALGLVAYVFGWAIWNGRVYPRWLGWGAFAVAVTNAAVAVGFSEFSQNLYYGQAFFVAWLIATAAVILAERRPV